MYNVMLQKLNALISKYHICKAFIDASASNLIHELKHQHGEYELYKRLKEEVLEEEVL
jgi:hypothetical protein